MDFEIEHEFDASLSTLESAVLSPELGDELARHLVSMETVETVEHDRRTDVVWRVLRFQAAAPFAMLKSYAIAHDAMRWDEESTYRFAEHASSWAIRIDPRFARYFGARGTYHLEAVTPERTRRKVVGRLDIHLRLLGPLLERAALVEIKKTYDAEARALRALAKV